MKQKPANRTAELRALIREYEAAIRGCESELRQIEAAMAPPADYTLPDDLEVYRRRRRLIAELSTITPGGGPPLLIAQVEQVADLVEQGLELDTAIRQVTIGADDEEETQDDN
jgi:hypothetical protein